MAISAVSAEDNSTNDIAISNDDVVLDENIDNVNLLKEEDEQSVSSNPLTDKHFFDLYRELQGSDINLTTDYIFDDLNATDKNGGIFIGDTKTINGNGHTIDGADRSRIFRINASNVVLSNIVFKNAYHDFTGDLNWGGAIIWDGVNGTIINCTFINCYSVEAAAILWNGDGGTVLNCNFDNCIPHDNAGSIKWVGNKGTVSGSNFANCHVVKGQGGAIVWEGADGTIDNSNFANLTAESVGYTTGGGAIYWSGENGRISNSNFANNSINWQGGAINLHNVNGIITGCNFFNCTAGGDGGAVYIHSENCTVSDSSFTNCNNGAVMLNNVNGTVKNSNFFNCTTDNSGGAIRVFSENCTVSNSNFFNCNSSSYGGAVYWFSNNGILTDCTFDNCHANNHGAVDWSGNNGIILNSNFTNCYSTSGSGGAVGKSGGFKTFAILNSNFINCSSKGHGGAILWGDGNGNDYTLNNSYFFNCSAVYQGGAIYGGVKAYNSNFEKCSAESGGAMYKGTATNCTFTDNKAKWGGAKHSNNDPTINCTFIGNTASDYAGAVYGNSIINCTFINNAANNTGGSIQNALNVLNCNIANSYANGSGGAIYSANSVVGCNFNDCHAKGGEGGAVYIGSGDIDKCNFTDCSANASGGAVKEVSFGTMYNSNFKNCSANVDGGAISSNHRFSVVNCTFTKNLAARDGGAVYGGSVVNGSFNGNSATARGGAIYSGSAENCTFWDNTASQGNNWYDTKVPILNLNVADFNSIYKSGETILLNATENNIAVNDVIITIRVSKNGTSVANYSCLTNEEWLVDLDAGSYKAEMTVEHNAYRFDNVNNNNANNNKKVITLTIDKRPTNITSSDVSTVYDGNGYIVATLTDISGKPLSGMLIFVDIIGVNATTDENGTVKVSTNGLVPANYTAAITFDGSKNYVNSSASVNVTVDNAVPEISSADVTTVYNGGKYLYVTLKDANGNPIVGAKISVNLNGAKSATTGSDGKAKVTTDKLDPKTSYTAVMTFAGDDRYVAASTSAKVTVKKVAPKLTAKSKTFKRSDKTKKYTVTLKTNKNVVMKKATVTIKVNKKTYTAKTNSKGVATFKLTKLTKKGKYTATVKNAATKYYSAKSVSVKITVK